MAKPGNVMYGDNYYGNGINSSFGTNNKQFFYERAGIEASNADFTFQQFSDVRNMPLHTGKQYRISVFHHIYDRMPYTDDTWNDINNKEFSEDFAKYGYLTSRNLADVTNEMYGADGKGYTAGTFTDNGRRLLEGEGAANKLTIKKSTYMANLEKFGEMLEYTEDALLFSEDQLEYRYRRELGYQANNVMEDLIQLDLLSTPTVILAGAAISKDKMGDGIGEGTPDPVTQTNAVEDSYKVNWGLMQTIFDKLLKNRAKPHTSAISASVKINTTGIPECYVALVGPQIRWDLENMIRGKTYEKHFVFTPVTEYGNQNSILKNEFGRVHHIRFIYAERMMVERGAGSVVDANYGGTLSYSEVTKTDGSKEKRFDLFPILIPCQGAFSTLHLTGQNKIKFTSKTPSNVDSLDVYGNRGFMTYSFWYGSIILRPERLLKAYVLASGSNSI